MALVVKPTGSASEKPGVWASAYSRPMVVRSERVYQHRERRESRAPRTCGWDALRMLAPRQHTRSRRGDHCWWRCRSALGSAATAGEIGTSPSGSSSGYFVVSMLVLYGALATPLCQGYGRATCTTGAYARPRVHAGSPVCKRALAHAPELAANLRGSVRRRERGARAEGATDLRSADMLSIVNGAGSGGIRRSDAGQPYPRARRERGCADGARECSVS